MLLSQTPNSIEPNSIHQDLELVPLTQTSWRVADSTWPEGDARRLLGYVEIVDGRYEMMWIQPRFGVSDQFDTLDDALTAAARRLRLWAK